MVDILFHVALPSQAWTWNPEARCREPLPAMHASGRAPPGTIIAARFNALAAQPVSIARRLRNPPTADNSP